MKSYLGMALALCSIVPCQADDPSGPDALTTELRALAADCATIIAKHEGGSVTVGEFSGSADIKGSAGPRVQLTLAAELEALGIKIDSEVSRTTDQPGQKNVVRSLNCTAKRSTVCV